MIPPNYKELTPPLVNISLWWFLDKFTTGMENRATVGKDFAEYLALQDFNNKLIHIEPIENNPHLFYVYPIKAWQESVSRLAKQKESSERQREIRFALEQEQRELEYKIQRRRDILAETIADSLKSPIAPKLAKHPRDFVEYSIFKALIGESPELAAKLEITKETIKEFSSLPKDPLWKNRFWSGN